MRTVIVGLVGSSFADPDETLGGLLLRRTWGLSARLTGGGTGLGLVKPEGKVLCDRSCVVSGAQVFEPCTPCSVLGDRVLRREGGIGGGSEGLECSIVFFWPYEGECETGNLFLFISGDSCGDCTVRLGGVRGGDHGPIDTGRGLKASVSVLRADGLSRVFEGSRTFLFWVSLEESQ